VASRAEEKKFGLRVRVGEFPISGLGERGHIFVQRLEVQQGFGDGMAHRYVFTHPEYRSDR
jgi:hypothetical protein